MLSTSCLRETLSIAFLKLSTTTVALSVSFLMPWDIEHACVSYETPRKPFLPY